MSERSPSPSGSRPVLITITKMLEMQAERRFPLLLQTETLFACVRFPALEPVLVMGNWKVMSARQTCMGWNSMRVFILR